MTEFDMRETASKSFFAPATMIFLLLIWFAIAVLPRINEAPDLDAMINLRESFVFFDEGFKALLKSRSGSTHPPALYLLNSLAFHLGGARPETVYLLGFFLLVLMCLTLYAIFSQYTDNLTAALASFVTGMNPLVVCCFIFMMSEALIALLFCLCTLAITRSRVRWLAISLCGFALVKQTALVLIGSFALCFFLVDEQTWRKRLFRSLVLLIPVLTCAGLWLLFLFYYDGTSWNNELMNKSSGGNPYLSFLISLTNGFTSIYFLQNLTNSLIINFNWIALVGVILCAWLCIKQPALKTKLTLTCAIGFFTYTVLVLPFPTWTIPRYGLPALLPALLITIFLIIQIKQKLLALILLGIIFVSAQFRSVDPVTGLIYGHFHQREQILYSTDYYWRGPDRAMYNLQLLLMSREQNRLVQRIFNSRAEVVVGNCHELKIGEKNWTVSLHPQNYPQFTNSRYIPCILESTLLKKEHIQRLNGRRVALLPPLRNIPTDKIKPISVTELNDD